MEYDKDPSVHIEGAFYAPSSYKSPIFNYFREEEGFNLSAILKPEDDKVENVVLKDTNLNIIKHSPEFITNKDPTTPTAIVTGKEQHFCFSTLLRMLMNQTVYKNM